MNNTFAFTPATPSQPTGLLAPRPATQDGWGHIDAQMEQLLHRLETPSSPAAPPEPPPPQRRMTMENLRDYEIRKARERIAGLKFSELRNLAATHTKTGRPNTRHDPALARISALAVQRLSGDDPWHDARTGADDLPEDDDAQPAV